MARYGAFNFEEDAKIAELFHAGASDQEIADQLGRTFNATRCRRWRLGMSRGRASLSFTPALIDTPAGKMTRREAAAHFGISFGTLCRRIWEGCAHDMLFFKGHVPRGTLKRPAVAYVKKRKKADAGHASKARYFEPYAEFKRRMAAERAAKAAAARP